MASSDERVWTVDCDQSGEVNSNELAEAMIEVGGMLHRLGGYVQMTARRARTGVPVPEFITEQVVLQWQMHLPMRRRPQPDLAEAEAVEEIDVEAEEEQAPEPALAE